MPMPSSAPLTAIGLHQGANTDHVTGRPFTDIKNERTAQSKSLTVTGSSLSPDTNSASGISDKGNKSIATFVVVDTDSKSLTSDRLH